MKSSLIAICLVCTVGWAQAAVTFDFDELSDGAGSFSISAYMTDVLNDEVPGATVSVSGARADDDGWLGNSSTFISTSISRDHDGDFELLFSTPIISLSGYGYVFDATPGEDFSIFAYDDTYGSTENPDSDAYVSGWTLGDLGEHTEYWWFFSWTVDDGDNTECYFTLEFASPVSLLVFSDDGVRDVGIDDIIVELADGVPQVSPVPAPSAVLLGSLGVGFVGWLRRRKAL